MPLLYKIALKNSIFVRLFMHVVQYLQIGYFKPRRGFEAEQLVQIFFVKAHKFNSF